jgi:hypothetical protein
MKSAAECEGACKDELGMHRRCVTDEVCPDCNGLGGNPISPENLRRIFNEGVWERVPRDLWFLMDLVRKLSIELTKIADAAIEPLASFVNKLYEELTRFLWSKGKEFPEDPEIRGELAVLPVADLSAEAVVIIRQICDFARPTEKFQRIAHVLRNNSEEELLHISSTVGNEDLDHAKVVCRVAELVGASMQLCEASQTIAAAVASGENRALQHLCTFWPRIHNLRNRLARCADPLARRLTEIVTALQTSTVHGAQPFIGPALEWNRDASALCLVPAGSEPAGSAPAGSAPDQSVAAVDGMRSSIAELTAAGAAPSAQCASALTEFARTFPPGELNRLEHDLRCCYDGVAIIRLLRDLVALAPPETP